MNAMSPKRRTVKELRCRAEITQRELASIVDVDSSTISRIENGHCVPSGITLQRLAHALGVDANDMLLGSGI
jgi:DNA-binding XRE family transcriptional regulator